MVNPDACHACGLCVTACPEKAIQLVAAGEARMSAALTVTRIANSCALLDFDGDIVLTDPYFTERWHLHRGEPLGMTIGELPRLSAIVVSHFFPNHWDTRGLAQFANKAEHTGVRADGPHGQVGTRARVRARHACRVG